jgi:hypothetical protein
MGQVLKFILFRIPEDGEFQEPGNPMCDVPLLTPLKLTGYFTFSPRNKKGSENVFPIAS